MVHYSARWKKRTAVKDVPTGPQGAHTTVLSIEDDAIIVAFRQARPRAGVATPSNAGTKQMIDADRRDHAHEGAADRDRARERRAADLLFGERRLPDGE